MQNVYKEIMRRMINKQAEVLFSTLDLVPGFDIKSTVETLGGEIRVKKELEENIEAQICPKEDSEIGFLIECKNNYDNDDYYIRFSIAHELGHLFLHMASPDNEKGYKLIGNYHKGSQNASIKEWEAEEFAASFLMPESRFRIEVEAARFNSEVEDKVAQLAKIFKVPYKSVITRGKSLEIW